LTDASKPNVGQQIRAIREKHELSLRALAELCGLSVNAVSLIERGENSPTVSSLHMLATALDVPITDFFQEQHEQPIVFVEPAQRLRSEVKGILMESLGTGLHNQQLEPFLITVAPGAGTRDEPVTHPGEEFVHCLSGEINYSVQDEVYRMTEGSSLLFNATQPHCFYNETDAPATLIIVFQSGSGMDLARKRHLSDQHISD
jgi:transcriptional regulator with XRE-family HTH domain